MPELNLVDRVRAIGRIDLAPSRRPPPVPLVVFAAAASVVGSVVADAILVKIGTSLFPSTKGFAHFRLSDYGLLTVAGVVVASVAWPVVTRITASPRWLFFRLAVLVTLVLWAPDIWLLAKGEPPKAVAVLVVMHLAIALVTYNLLVHLAPVGPEASPGASPAPAAPATVAPAGALAPPLATEPGAREAAPLQAAPPAGRAAWLAMAWGVGLEFALGLAGLLLVPFGRPDEWLPSKGEAIYAAHAALGGLLGVGSLVLLVRAAHAGRLARIGAVVGLVGMALGVVGGVLATYHAARLGGMALMLVGIVVAGFGYLTPIIG
ncbi:MAG TPA: hypothetical protein VMU75_10865 [Acidimicrobiales bacterium]|nr:hypothetical protein [Acidimicrobiales bacterium]